MAPPVRYPRPLDAGCRQHRVRQTRADPVPLFDFARLVLRGRPWVPLTEGVHDVTETVDAHADWRCHLGHHHYVVQADDNPEMRGQSYLECSRCGKKKDPPTYGPMPPGAVGGGLIRGTPE